MARRRQHGRRWRTRVLKGCGALLALLLLAFGILQLVLATPWARKQAASKVSQRLGGLSVEIADLGWTPWSGVEVEGLKVAQPEALNESLAAPLIVVDRIQVWPKYTSFLKGERAIHELRLERPSLHVAVEMLVSVFASSAPPAEPPAVASNAGRAGVQALPPAMESGPASGSPAVAAKPSSAVREEPAKATPPKPVRDRVRVVVEDGSFELVRAEVAKPLVGLKGASLDLPLFGEPGELKSLIGLVEMNGQALEEELAIRVASADDTLRFHLPGPEASQVYGEVVVSLKAGLPFAAELGVRMAGGDPLEIHPLANVEWSALESRVRGGGWLLAPGSWNGLVALEAAEVTCRVAGTPFPFDQARVSLSLARGVLQSPDFRLTGDAGAVLGNGWLTAGAGAVVVRVVVPESVVGMLNEQLAERIDDGVFAFKPLEPGNRWYSDVSIWRREDRWMVAFGDGGAVVPMEEVLKGE